MGVPPTSDINDPAAVNLSRGSAMGTHKEHQKAAYNKYYLEYESSVANVHKRLKPYTIDVWKSGCVGKDILDLGCGNAYVLNQLQLSKISFKSYTGIDISDEMISNNINSYYGPQNISFLVDDAEVLKNLGDTQYDIVISYGCMHHLEHPNESIKSVYKYLRDEGQLFAVELNREHSANSFTGLYLRIFGFDPEKVKTVLKKMMGRMFNGQREPSKRDTYSGHHPGHPGKRIPDEYREMLQTIGFRNISINCLYLDLLPYFLYESNLVLFRFMVAMSQPLLRVDSLKDAGSVLLIEAKK
jgi:ubiquinone/menaquinone biosynthesis C-methylase UbiE